MGEKKLDKSTPIPLYFQLKEMILESIKDGTYQRDSLIPTEKEYSEKYQISRTTVRQAIGELVQEGWLYRIKSKGTFVSRPKISQDFVQKVESYNEQIERTGRTPSTEVLELRTETAPKAVAEALNLPADAKVIYLKRRRFADEDPIVVLDTYLPYEPCKFILEHDLAKDSLYDTLSLRDDVSIYCVKRCIEAVEATAKDAQYLNMKKGKPVLGFRSVGYTIQGIPMEYSLARYRGDRSSFEVSIFTEK